MEAVVAFDLELGIGKDGGLPWHIPADLAKFKELTMGKTVVMGRRTWESLPESVRPLPGRQNVVVSRNGYFGTDAWRAPSIEAALRNFPDAMVIGGGQLYKALLPHIDVIHASVVEGVWGCDTFFPALDGFTADYVEVHPDFTTVKYVRTGSI